ncbi:MAG: enoyl-CoA hydratase/isomerase family protein [Halieaceae bacterium]|jgi:enoyl-CoA hydratase|nr:enoyl-CoA hydratase/isomerase family protein [Halieaceae bacterium]
MYEDNWQYLTLTRSQRVLTVKFDSGHRVNSLNNALMRELTQLANQLQDDTELNAIILTGRSNIFSAGMDLRDPEAANARNSTLAARRKLCQVGPKMCAAWEALEPITIAAIEGWCIGGGMALISAFDWRVAAEDAKLHVPELKLGMNMSWQSVPRFVNLIGPAKTKQLLILAEPLKANVALDWGLVDYLASSGQTLDRAAELAEKVAAMPPIPVRMAKRGINASANALNDATSFMDADQFMLAQSSQDALEGAMAFFEKRPAEFKGN